MKKRHYRVIVVGSGPAGLTAAVYASRANLEPLVVEGGGGDPTDVPGGQLMLTTDVDNYPGFPEGILGPELMKRMRKQAERFSTEFTTGTLTAANLRGRPLELTLAEGAVSADSLIIATGAAARWLGLPEELQFRTQWGGVSACATCDGFFYKDKHVLVVGGGDTAMEEATFLTKFANKVTVVHRRDELRASKIMQQRARSNPKIGWLFDSVVEKILGGKGKGVTGAVVRNVKTGVASEVAAGDVADQRYRQAVTAAGTGCMAAIDAEKFLSH